MNNTLNILYPKENATAAQLLDALYKVGIITTPIDPYDVDEEYALLRVNAWFDEATCITHRDGWYYYEIPRYPNHYLAIQEASITGQMAKGDTVSYHMGILVFTKLTPA